MAQYDEYTDIKIGVSVGALASVTALQYGGVSAKCPPPKTSFREAEEVVTMSDGSVKLLGEPVVVWAFDGIPYAARKALRAYISSGLSVGIFIASPDGQGDIQNWEAVMHWPVDAPGYLSFGFVDSLVLTFRRCTQQ